MGAAGGDLGAPRGRRLREPLRLELGAGGRLCRRAPRAWPLRAEQFLNEAFLVEVLRVGVRVREVASKADLEAVVLAEAMASASASAGCRVHC